MSMARQSTGSLIALTFGVCVSILLPRVLGSEGRGEYLLAVKTAGLVMAIAQWGIPEVLLQYLADGRQSAPRLAGTSLILAVGASIVAGVVVLAVYPLASPTILRGVDVRLVTLSIAGSAIATVGLFARRFIQLAGQVQHYNVLDVGRNAVFLSASVALVALGIGGGAAGTSGWFLAEALFGVYGVIWLARRYRGALGVDLRLIGALIRSGTPIQMGVLATFVGGEAGSYLINARFDLATVGIYAVALSVARLVLQVSMSLRTVLQPRLIASEIDAAATTVRVTRHGILWMILFGIAVSILAPILPWVFGRDFVGMAPLVIALWPGMLCYGIAQLLTGHLLRSGHRGDLVVSSWAFAIVAIAMQALGASRGDLLLTAIGLSLAYATMATIVTARFCKWTGFSPLLLLPRWSDVAGYQTLISTLRKRS